MTMNENKTMLSGFRPLRSGRIHLRCPKCGRKQSNMARYDCDPADAALAEVHCPKCASGSKDPGTQYFDASGREVEQIENEQSSSSSIDQDEVKSEIAMEKA